MSNDRDDLAALLADLRTTLDELERTLDTDRRGDRASGDDRRSIRREPPRGRDVVRFTEEYTIPTVIAILETTVQSLELLRGVLRLADPERSLRRDGDGLEGVDRRVVDGTERALDDLRRALTGTEEPTDPVARDVFREARTLTAEIESRLADAREAGRDSWSQRSERDHRSVVIPVDDGETMDGNGDAMERTGDATDDGTESDSDLDDAGGEIDVDAELESIKAEVRGESAATDRDSEEASRDSGEESRDSEEASRDSEESDEAGSVRREDGDESA